jgi:outer membrane receptor protein involved in Fe transport
MSMVTNDDLLHKVPKNALRLAVSAACAGVPVAHAAPALEEIVVTATKREANMQDIPIPITVFTNEQIVKQGFKTFSDYVGQIPSLAVSERQPGATSVLMRGCASQGLSFSDSSTTSVYLDEQPITAAGYNPDPRLIDVERVEALSGPQGTLFGDAAQCGTLRIITNKPDTAEFNSWVDVTGMKTEHGDTGYDMSAMVNIPLVDDTLAVRLVGFVAEEPGFVDNVFSVSPGSEPSLGVDPGENFDNSEFVDDDVNTGTYYGGRVGLRWQTAEDWTVDFNGIYQKYELKDGFGDADLNQQFYEDTDTFPRLGELDQVRFGNESWEDEWYQLSVTAEGDLGFADLVVTGAYYHREAEYNADATAYVQAFQQLGDDARSNEPYIDYYGYEVIPAYFTFYDFNGDPQAVDFDDRDTDSYTLEARLSSSADSDSRWGWLGGVFYNHREVDELFTANVRGLWDADTGETPAGYYLNYSYYNYNAGSSSRSDNWFTGTYDSDLDQFAVFGEVSFDLTENLVITGGGRYYDVENDYTVVQAALVDFSGGTPDCDIAYCFTGANDTGSSDDDGFVWKANIAWTVSDQLLYATYSEGFRRGGANSARPGSIFGSVTNPDDPTDPAGSKNQYGPDYVDNLRVNITAYHMVWDNIQVQARDTVTDFFALGIINLPKSKINGVDMWVNWAATDSLQFDATAGWNDGYISSEFTLGDVTIDDNTDLPLMPDWKGSLSGTYTFNAKLLSAEPFVIATYSYVGESTNSLGIESSSFVYPVRKQPSYQLVKLRAGLEAERWSAAFYVDNVFDEYAEQFYNNRFAQQRLTINRPRTYGINFRTYFGNK